jgi:hypothetical protein
MGENDRHRKSPANPDQIEGALDAGSEGGRQANSIA